MFDHVKRTLPDINGLSAVNNVIYLQTISICCCTDVVQEISHNSVCCKGDNYWKKYPICNRVVFLWFFDFKGKLIYLSMFNNITINQISAMLNQGWQTKEWWNSKEIMRREILVTYRYSVMQQQVPLLPSMSLRICEQRTIFYKQPPFFAKPCNKHIALYSLAFNFTWKDGLDIWSISIYMYFQFDKVEELGTEGLPGFLWKYWSIGFTLCNSSPNPVFFLQTNALGLRF